MSEEPPASAEFENLHEIAMRPRPSDWDARAEWLTALNRGCVLAVERGARIRRLAHAHRAVEFGWERPVLFHNAACVFCALDMPDAAIDALRRAVRFAYHGVARLADDKDLALIAGREDFRALVDPISGRAAEIQRRAAECLAQPGGAEANRWLGEIVEWHPARRNTAPYVVMRPGVAFTLYADAPWPDVAPRIADALEAFLAFVGSDALSTRWSAKGWVKLTPRAISKQLAELRGPPPGTHHLSIFYGEGEPPGSVGRHAFRFTGGPDSSLELTMEFPLDAVAPPSLPGWLGFIAGIASAIPFRIGYACLGFRHNWTRGSTDVARTIHAYCGRYIAVDPLRSHFWDGDVVPGPHWIDLVGREFLAALGGREAVRTRLPEAVEMHTVGDGILLRCAEYPPVGDLETGAPDIAYLPDVARLLAPLPHVVDGDWPGWPERLQALSSVIMPPWTPIDLFGSTVGPIARQNAPRTREDSTAKPDASRARAALERAQELLGPDDAYEGFVWLNLAAHSGSEEAATWAELIIEQERLSMEEVVDAYCELARWFEQGTNTERDAAAARSWFERAAEAGSEEAEAILAERYQSQA